MTVSELGHRMTASEFMEWMAFAEIEPFGPLREDQRAGTVAAVIATVNRGKSHPEPFTASDFFASLKPPVQPVDRTAKLKAWAAAMNMGRRPKRPVKPDA